MNEYLYEITMNEPESDEAEQYVQAVRKVAKRYRTYFDSQNWMSNTQED